MYKSIIILFLILTGMNVCVDAQTAKYQLKIVSCVESLVPNGMGRSRMITTNVEMDFNQFTSQQTAAKNDRNKSKRKDIRLKEYEETKLLNFYNEAGIRFQNIASNDAIVTSKINEMLADGWDLYFVETGVESKMISLSVKKEIFKALLEDESESANDPNGLFMTRYFFRKSIN